MLSSFHTVARAGADGVAGWTEAMREVLVARPLREIMAMGMTCVQDGDCKPDPCGTVTVNRYLCQRYHL
jgi:hypothetical protein